MAKSLDGLIHHLLDNVALCGEHGASPSDYIKFVRSYYDPLEVSVTDGNISSAQKPSNIFNVDRPFLEQVWKWLTEHPEINLGDHARHKRLTLSDAEARDAASEQSKISEPLSCISSLENTNTTAQEPKSLASIQNEVLSPIPQDTETPTEVTSQSLVAPADGRLTQNTQMDDVTPRPNTAKASAVVSEVSTHHARIRLYTSENRMWHALTGHGLDLNKVKALDFACLSVIAASGPKGIHQNELIKKSGQDKRSLPLRTERLYEDGYVEKKRVCIQLYNPKRLLHTSHLLLKRFAGVSTSQTNISEPSNTAEDHIRKRTTENKNPDTGKEVEPSEQNTAVRKLGRPVPQWTPDRPLSNQIFHLIDRSGTEGMTMNDIRDSFLGEYVRRPAAEFVTRLAECWQMSQPLHLRHLSIIRDTILKGKGSIYNYYTYESFNELVEKGLGFWEAVVTVPDDRTAGKNFAASLDAVPELDDFGFPVIDPSLLNGHENDATLQECASTLKSVRFLTPSTGSVNRRQLQSLHDTTPSHRKARSQQTKVLACQEPSSPAQLLKPDRPAYLSVGVKIRGRPREFPKVGTPIDIEKMDIRAVKKLKRSQKYAEKYARSKMEKEISWRISEGGDAVLVASEVLNMVECFRKEAGQESIPEFTKAMILHTYAGGPEPPQLQKKRGRRKRGPYRPSMAAHTMLVPNPRKQVTKPKRQVVLGPVHQPNPKATPYWPSMAAHTIFVPSNGKAKNPLKRIRRPPTHLLQSGFEADDVPTNKKRRYEAHEDPATIQPYRPSVAAQERALVPEPSLVDKAPQEKVKRKRGRPRKQTSLIHPPPKGKESSNFQFCYLPSISAHSGSFLPMLSQSSVQLLEGDGSVDVPVQRDAMSCLGSHSCGTQFCYLPSIAAHSLLFFPERVPIHTIESETIPSNVSQHSEAPKISANQKIAPETPNPLPAEESSLASSDLHGGLYPEGFYPGWVKYMLKYYGPDLKDIARPQDGVYLGRTKHRRKRNIEPAGFRPRSYKVVVFKLARLREIPWFIEVAKPPQREPPSMPKGQSLISSAKPRLSEPLQYQNDKTSAEESLPNTCRLSYHSSQAPRGALSELGTPFNGSRVLTSQHSQSPIVGGLDSDPRTEHAPPHADATGRKRKRDECCQPHRSPPLWRAWSVDSHSGYFLQAQAVQSPESAKWSGSPYYLQKKASPAFEDLSSYHLDNANPAIAKDVSGRLTNMHTNVKVVHPAAGQGHATVTDVSPPMIAETDVASRLPSNHSTGASLPPLSDGMDVLPPFEKKQIVDTKPLSNIEIPSTVAKGEPLFTDVPDDTSAPIDKANAMLDPSDINRASRNGTPGPPHSDEYKIACNNLSVQAQAPRSDECSQDPGHAVLIQTSNAPERPVTAQLSSAGPEQRNGNVGTHTKPSEPQEAATTPIFPSADEAQLPCREGHSVHDEGQGDSLVAKQKPMTGRKLFGRMSRQGGSVAMLRKKVVMEIIDKCGGIFSGHRELVKAFVIAWRKRGLEGGTPEEKTMQSAVDALCNEGMLQQVKFAFKDQKGLKVMKDMLIYPNIDVMDPRVKDVQKRMIAHYPRFFWPLAAVPPDEYSIHHIQKIMNGKSQVQDAKYMALKAEEQLAQIEPDGQNGVEERETALSVREKSDHILRIPSIIHNSPSHSKRHDGSRPRRRGRRSGEKSLAEFLMRPQAMKPPLPESADAVTNGCKDLVWLPETYAFSEFNYEEERPTVLEPSTRGDYHRRHARYGTQMESLKAKRRFDHNDSRIYSTKYLSNPSAATDFTSLVSALRSDHPFTSYTICSFPEQAVAESAITWVAVEQPHNFRPYPTELIVNFMDPIHYFHQSSGTFSVGFSGLAPPRHIIKAVGTASKPYSHGPRTIHTEFPSQRGPRNLLPRRSLGAEDTQFEKEVDGLLRWELGQEGIEDIKYGPLHFVNHVFTHVHTTAEAAVAKMDLIHGVTVPSDGGRIKHRRLAEANKTRPQASDSRNDSRAADEPLPIAKARALLKRRRLTTLVEGTSQETSSRTVQTVQTDGDSRPAKFRRVRGPREFRVLPKDDEERLLNAVMVVRTLTGGIHESIDWALVAKACDSIGDKRSVASYWPAIRVKFKLALPKMQADFQEMFAKAYEAGDVPALDFDDLENYDWKWLMEWTVERLGAWNQSQPDLPARRAELDDLYTMEESSEIDINDYYEVNGRYQNTVAKRQNIITSSSYVYPMKKEGNRAKGQPHNQLHIARTWVRANFMNPQSSFNQDVATAKLRTLPVQLIDKALIQLIDEKVLSHENKGRLIPGRNYHMNDRFLTTLRKNLLPQHFQRAASFKRNLDKHFAEKGSAPFSYTASDGDAIAMMNLVAHKRVTLVSVDVPMDEWGLVDSGYESRLMDLPNRLRFQVEMRPLPSYIGGNPLEPLPEPPCQRMQDPMAKIPLWIGINLELIPQIWGQGLAAVLAVLSSRVGVNAAEIEKVVKPAMEAWEIDMILVWLVEAKAATRVGSGYALDEWWWLTIPADEGADVDTLTADEPPVEDDGLSNEQALDGEESSDDEPLNPQYGGFTEFSDDDSD